VPISCAMDGVSVASGIAGLITLALQISGTIRDYVVAARNKAKDIEELQGELVLLSENLNSLRDILEDESLKDRSFDPDSVLWKAIQDCRKRIERIGDELLPSNGGRFDRALDKLKWPFQAKEVLKMVDNLRRFSSIFQFAINIENCKILAKNSKNAEKTLKEVLTASRKVSELQLQYGMNATEATKRAADVERVLQLIPLLLQDTLAEVRDISHGVRTAELREREKRKTEILDWLSSISSLNKHRDVQAKRVAGTGEWLLNHEDIVKWSSDTVPCQHILCVGGPGTGKTLSSSLIVDHLRERHRDADSVVAYYYCSWDDAQLQTPVHFASTLLRQLCNKLTYIPTCVNNFYQNTKDEVKDQAWFADLQDVLYRVLNTFARCFLVIDALDELASQQRSKVVDVVQGINTAVGDKTLLRLFATSRPHLSYPKVDFKVLDIVANEHDIRVVISNRLEEHPEADHMLDTHLKQQIVDTLTLNAGGMFLLPALQLDAILNNDTKSGVRRQLGSLSSNLSELYTATLRRIMAQPEHRQCTARKTLMWLSHARRQLKVSQLLHALSVHPENPVPNLDRDDMLHPKIVLDSCCGLVAIEPDSGMIKFNHSTVEEYLRSNETHNLFTADECELLISKTLLIYMRLQELEHGHFKSRQGFEDLLLNHPLLEYAAFEWGHHVRNVEENAIVQDLALRFLNSGKHMMAVVRTVSANSANQNHWHARMFSWALSGGAGVSLAASFGLDNTIRRLVDDCGQNMSAKNMHGNNALHETSIRGFESTAQLLISKSFLLLHPHLTFVLFCILSLSSTLKSIR
jgi:Cdc6-like AAA superfamily ATPase